MRTGVDPMSLKPESICILDDDASVRHSIVQLLDSDGLKGLSFEDAEAFFAHARSHTAPPRRAQCVDARNERPGSAGAAPRGIARYESNRDDRQGNTPDSRRCAGRWRVCLSREAVRRRGISFHRPSKTPLRGGK